MLITPIRYSMYLTENTDVFFKNHNPYFDNLAQTVSPVKNICVVVSSSFWLNNLYIFSLCNSRYDKIIVNYLIIIVHYVSIIIHYAPIIVHYVSIIIHYAPSLNIMQRSSLFLKKWEVLLSKFSLGPAWWQTFAVVAVKSLLD